MFEDEAIVLNDARSWRREREENTCFHFMTHDHHLALDSYMVVRVDLSQVYSDAYTLRLNLGQRAKLTPCNRTFSVSQ